MTPLFFCCNRVSSIFERIAADHFDGADEKYAVKSAGGVKEFDPLRDGPLRYLGYANECGCVHNCWGSRAYVAPFCTLQHARRAPCTWAPCVLSCLLSATCMHARSEAFAAWLPLWGVPMSYAVAVGYVLVDTADKGLKAYALAQQELDANASLHPTVDTPRCVSCQCCLLRGMVTWSSV